MDWIRKQIGTRGPAKRSAGSTGARAVGAVGARWTLMPAGSAVQRISRNVNAGIAAVIESSSTSERARAVGAHVASCTRDVAAAAIARVALYGGANTTAADSVVQTVATAEFAARARRTSVATASAIRVIRLNIHASATTERRARWAHALA